jgi:DNA polymerase-3 subunit alpha
MILVAREEAGGHFKSLADFCSQIDLRVVNRRAIETLILSGAFDHLQSNRNQLLQDLELVMAWAQKRTKEKETGQMNLFDLMGAPAASPDTSAHEFEQAPSAPPVPDFSLQEKLKLEKEHLGFYVSEHPLKAVQKAAQILSPISLGEIEGYRARQRVSAVAIMVAVKKIITRKGTPMAFVTLEDVSGQAEGVVFPDNYERLLPALIEDRQVMIWGKIDKREERIQLMIEDIEAIEAVRMVMINLTPQQIFNNSAQQQLKNILRSSATDNKTKGRVPVLATVTEGLQKHVIRFGENYWVEDPHQALDSLQQAGFQASSKPLVSSP